MQQSSITVGLPVYNAMPFFPEAIESLLHQTVSDFNILVIVDGADDRSLQYLETVLDDRLRVLTQPNRGLTATLNRMLHETRIGWYDRTPMTSPTQHALSVCRNKFHTIPTLACSTLWPSTIHLNAGLGSTDVVGVHPRNCVRSCSQGICCQFATRLPRSI